MNINTEPIKKLLRSNKLSALNVFDVDTMELIFDLYRVRDRFQILKDSNNMFLLVFHTVADTDYLSCLESDFKEYNYYSIDNLDDVFGKINEIIKEFCNEIITFCLESKSWWSFLPNWICLNPKFISPKYSNFIENKLSEITSTINIEIDLTKKERKVLDRWQGYITNFKHEDGRHSIPNNDYLSI